MDDTAAFGFYFWMYSVPQITLTALSLFSHFLRTKNKCRRLFHKLEAWVSSTIFALDPLKNERSLLHGDNVLFLSAKVPAATLCFLLLFFSSTSMFKFSSALLAHFHCRHIWEPLIITIHTFNIIQSYIFLCQRNKCTMAKVSPRTVFRTTAESS